MERRLHTVRIASTGEEIPVGKIFCLGRNYAEHALEMNEISSADKGHPIIFLKPPTALLRPGSPIKYPPMTKNLHHEIELVALLGEKSRVLAYGIGLDMTMRDVQEEAKSRGLPWSIAKGFDGSAPVSDFVLAEDIPNVYDLEMKLWVNGKLRQHSSTENMIFTIEDIIEFLQSVFTLEFGDLIFTGTPAGVGVVYPGDVIEAEITGIGKISYQVE